MLEWSHCDNLHARQPQRHPSDAFFPIFAASAETHFPKSHLHNDFALNRELLREQSLDIGEVIYEIRGFSGDELTAMIASGEIRDAKTLVGLFMALSRRPEGVRIAGD